MTTPDIQSLVESVKPVRDILGEPVIADSHQLQKSIWRTKVESAESRIAQLEAELAEEKRKVTAMEVALAKWNNHFFWRQSPDEDGMHSIPTKIIQDCIAVTQFALAALTTPSEKGEL